jgi:hypothetical protein
VVKAARKPRLATSRATLWSQATEGIGELLHIDVDSRAEPMGAAGDLRAGVLG